MSYTVNLQQRLQQLKAIQVELPELLRDTAKSATQRAVEAAADATPPKAGTGRLPGTNTVTGQLKQHWAIDSKIAPVRKGNAIQTELNNNMEYASYVNDGHRMDRHFVPGLYIDENGQLNYDPSAKVGLIVGTKTKYVKGEFMVDKAKEAYQKTILAELDQEIQRLLK